MRQALQQPEFTREAALVAAKDELIEAEKLRKGSGSWQMACVAGISRNSRLCKRWLERARDQGELPSSAEIGESPFMQEFRGQKWFKRFLQSVP